MSVLICKNTAAEGPGTIGDFLDERGIAYRVVDLSQGEEPADWRSHDALVLLGGPMSVNEADRYPYLGGEEEMAKVCIADGRKVLGICLGAQIMAKALGSTVYRSPQREIGWHTIRLTEEGQKDAGMRSLAMQPDAAGGATVFPVFHWHEETFDLPAGAVRLASSDLCANQIFRYGDSAYGFQCHIEVTGEMIYSWMKGESIEQDALRKETQRLYADYRMRAWSFYRFFFSTDQGTGGEA